MMPAAEKEVDLASPPVKKLKQARLPFKVLTPKPVSPQPLTPTSTQKKRKSSDPNFGPQKAAKTPKNDENSPKPIRPKSVTTDAENEVSSSSETNLAKPKIEEEKPKSVGLLDKFVRTTQQLEVSTSGEDCCVDLTEGSDNEAEGKEIGDLRDTKPETCEEEPKTESDSLNISTTERKESEETAASDDESQHEESDEEKDVSIVSLEEPSQSESESPGREKSGDSDKTGVSKNSQAQDSASSKKKEADREKKKLERQQKRDQAKAEKERVRKEEKERKEKERLEAKKKRDEEKQKLLDQKNKEKEDKLRQKEDERKKKLLEKEEERKKKQDIIDAKNEEKRKKEEDKLKAEEEVKAKQEKKKQYFSKFFTKSEKAQTKAAPEETGRFFGFELKKDMRIAPCVRIPSAVQTDKVQNLDKQIVDQVKPRSDLYVAGLKDKNYVAGKSGKTWPFEASDPDVDILIPDSEPRGRVMRAKLLQFKENHRPAYYGTWRRTSRSVTGRAPYARDATLDYEVDSDDEWEEEEPGESLSNSEDEGSDDEAKKSDEEDEDGFFVPHGYLSEGEGCEDEEDADLSPERMKARQLAKAKAWDQEMKGTKKCEVLKPVCVGCCWFGEGSAFERDPTWEILKQFTAVPLMPTPISTDEPTTKKEAGKPGVKDKKKNGFTLLSVPDEALPDLIRLVHGNIFGGPKLIREFQVYWRRKSLGLSLINTEDGDAAAETEDNPADSEVKESADAEVIGKISKRQLHNKLREIAVYEKRDRHRRLCWYVHENVLDKHGLKDLPIPTDWHWLTKSNKQVQKQPKNVESSTPKQAVKKHPQGASTPNIKQFAVAGYTPPVPSPTAAKTPIAELNPAHTPKSNQKLRTNSTDTPKGNKSVISPSALFTPPPPDSSQKTATPKDRSQRTLMSMFSPPPQPKAKSASKAADSIAVKTIKPDVIMISENDEKPGDSADVPMEID